MFAQPAHQPGGDDGGERFAGQTLVADGLHPLTQGREGVGLDQRDVKAHFLSVFADQLAHFAIGQVA